MRNINNKTVLTTRKTNKNDSMARGRPKRNTKPVNYAALGDTTEQRKKDNEGEDEDFQGLEESETDEEIPNDVDELGLPEEEADEDEDEGDIAEEETSKKRKSKSQPAKAKKTAKSQTTPPVEGSAKEIRLTRHITNLKDKLFRLFGSNDEKMKEVLKLRKDWEKSIFDFSESQLREYIPSIIIKNVPNTTFTKLTKEQFNEKFKLERPVKFQFNTEPRQVIPSGEVIFKKRAQILNTGGLITDIAWLSHGSETDEQILAVAVSDITDTAIAPEFSLLGGKAYRSGFLIYALDTQSYTLRLIKAVTHNWGNSWDLQWKNHKGLGVLSAVFNDGKIRLLHFDYDDDDDAASYFEITEPSYEYEVPTMKISSYDWIGDKIICGTDKGYVAEFILGDPAPSYVIPIHAEYIFSVRSGESKYDETMVFTSCADGSSVLFSTKDIQTTKNVTPKSKSISKSVIYSPQLYSFIQLEAQYSAKLLPARALFMVTPVVKHDGSTESIATSNLHPMLLSGGADGKIKITNLARRLMNGQKQTLSNHKILSLWELQYGGSEDLYRLVENLEVETLSATDNANVANIYPSGVSINSIKWNENENAGKWYAAGSTSGLLILECLQSV